MQTTRKQSVTLQWRIAESDREWAHLCQPPVPAVKSQRGLLRRLSELLLLMVGLSSIGGWYWYTTQAEFQEAQTALIAAVQQEALVAPSASPAATPVARLEPLQAEHALLVVVKPKLSGAQFAPTVRVLKLQGDQAVVMVLTPAVAHTPAHRQTQFYRRTDVGWQRTAPDATLWGPPQELETTFFRWHYRQNDAPVVAAVAPQLEVIYATLRRNFGLAQAPQPSTLTIEVSVTQPTGAVSPWFGAAEAYVVASPALYQAPIDVTDAELLLQSLALPLANMVMDQARAHHQLPSSWQPLLDGLRLWQQWDLDLPLSNWRQEVVSWLYRELTRADVGQRVVLPAHYTELCATHTLWLPSPLLFGIPLACGDLDQRVGYFSATGGRSQALHLTHRSAPTSGAYAEPSIQGVDQRGQTVALATLIDYAVTTYGRERLPMLVAALQHHKRWETLLPAVYGMSAAEFEAGWQEYLTRHYGGSGHTGWFTEDNTLGRLSVQGQPLPP